MVMRYNESTQQFYIDPQHVADGDRVWASDVVSTLGYHGLSRSKFPGGHTFVVAEGRIYRWRGSSLDLRFDPVMTCSKLRVDIPSPPLSGLLPSGWGLDSFLDCSLVPQQKMGGRSPSTTMVRPRAPLV